MGRGCYVLQTSPTDTPSQTTSPLPRLQEESGRLTIMVGVLAYIINYINCQ